MTSTHAGSTARTSGRFSMGAYSMSDGDGVVSFKERFRRNALHLSVNICRYDRFSRVWLLFTAVYRLCQNYSVLLLPSCDELWTEGESGRGIMNFLSAMFRFKAATTNLNENGLLHIALFAIVTTIILVFTYAIWRNPATHSSSNDLIFFLKLMFETMIPIVSIWVASVSGDVFRVCFVEGDHAPMRVVMTVLAIVSIVVITYLRYLGCRVVKMCRRFEPDSWMRPWAMNCWRYEHIESCFFVLAFFEEFLDFGNIWHRRVYMGLCLLIANPFMVAYLVYKPFFQNVLDVVHYACQFMVGFVAAMLMILKITVIEVPSSGVLCTIVVSYALSYIVMKLIMEYSVKRRIRKIYHAYKAKSPGLMRAMCTWNPGDQQMILSNDAYVIVESFESLGIRTAREFQYYLAIGAVERITAIRNLDFVKWGMGLFSDRDSLVMCQQVCEHFGSDMHTPQMLLQKIRDVQGESMITLPMLYCMELQHADTIIDEPYFLRTLLTKARGSMERARRSLNRFWGSVLTRRVDVMESSLCRLRDSIYEAGVHFDEMCRCYPLANSAVALNLTFLTAIKGHYLGCHEYMNHVTAYYYEKYGTKEEESGEKPSAVFNNPTKLFAVHSRRIRKFMEHEKLTRVSVRKMPMIIWAVTVLAGVTMLGYLVVMMFTVEVMFSRHPALVNVIRSCNDANMDLVLLLLGIRRLCFYANGLETGKLEFADCATPELLDRDKIVPWLTDLAENYSAKAWNFYKSTAKYNWTAKGLIGNEIGMAGYGVKLYRIEGLGFIMDLFGNVMRNSMTNTAKRFGDESRKEVNWYVPNPDPTQAMYDAGDFGDICLMRETAGPMENLNSIAQLTNSFGLYFREAGRGITVDLNTFLFFSRAYFPSVLTVLFSLMLIVTMVCLHKEGQFRLTLFLALPEAVVSDVCKHKAIRRGKSGMREYTNSTDRTGDAETETDTETVDIADPLLLAPGQVNGMAIPELDMWEAKRRIIEGLYQFSSGMTRVSGVGLKPYAVWFCITVAVCISFFWALSAYATGVNNDLDSWSTRICYAMLRCVWTEMTMVCMGDVFVAAVDTELLLSRSIYELATVYGMQFQEHSRLLHRPLLYGGGDINEDFISISNMLDETLKLVSEDVPSELPTQIDSRCVLVHDAYRKSGGDVATELFYLVTKMFIGMVEREFSQTEVSNRVSMWSSLNISTPMWEEYEHLNAAHVVTLQGRVVDSYCDQTIDAVNETSLVIFGASGVAFILLAILIIGPMRVISRSIYQYYDTLVHMLIQVPPDVFRSSLYINKWLKGQVTRSNYHNYQAVFDRVVPPEIRRATVLESPEKVMFFNAEGVYVDGCGSYDDDEVNSRESKTVAGVIGLIVDGHTGLKSMEEIERVALRFIKARDGLNDVIIHAPAATGGHVMITVTGITSTEYIEAGSPSNNYYEYIALLVKDISEEVLQCEKFAAVKEKALHAITQYLPSQIVSVFHENQHSFKTVGQIVTVMAFRCGGFRTLLGDGDVNDMSDKVGEYTRRIMGIMEEFPTISKLNVIGGIMLFVAGLFDEESTGLREAEEMMRFCARIESYVLESEQVTQKKLERNYAIYTGGPVVYRLIMGYAIPRSMAFGRPISSVKDMVRRGTSGLVIDQTTYHCVNGLNFETESLPDMTLEYGEVIPCFSVNLAGRGLNAMAPTAKENED